MKEKYENDMNELPKDQWGMVKTVSLKAWIKKNDSRNDELPVGQSVPYNLKPALLGRAIFFA